MKYIMSMVVFLFVVTLYFILRPEPDFQSGVSQNVRPVAEDNKTVESGNKADIDGNTEVDKRRVKMHAIYDDLEKGRRNLERRLSRLKALLWDVHLPAEESEQITNQMKNAYALLKNKKLLGAFSGVQELQDELLRINYANRTIKEIEEKIRNSESG